MRSVGPQKEEMAFSGLREGVVRKLTGDQAGLRKQACLTSS